MCAATAKDWVAGPPAEDDLRAAAVAYLARYSASEAALRRVLLRRIDRWCARARVCGEDAATIEQAAQAARRCLPALIAALTASGALDDAGFAASRAQRLIRGGRSRRAVMAALTAKGIARATAEAAVPTDPEAELAAALALARRRRIGPFRRGAADALTRRRELGVLARAGFPEAVALCALDMDAASAAALVLAVRHS